MKKPERSLGSNQVLLGGMIWSASEMAMSCSTVTGNIEKATAKSRLSTSFSSSAVPRIPPMKSMRLLVRGSSMPRRGARRRSWRMETSSWSMGEASGAGFQVRRYHWPLRYMQHSPVLEGDLSVVGSRVKMELTLARNSSRSWQLRSLTARL
jgi:hypothetical protein